jgi:acyl-CoA synthetase (AMP-forming)/AMP-acid ligase II
VAIGADGEIIYRGPGVMLGYATRREDLTLGDSLQGVLRTGDVGRLDAEGFLYITGRLTRYCKIFGHRVSLDEVEAFIRSGCAAAAIEKEGVIFIFLETATSTASVSPAQLARQFHLPPQSFRVERIESMPRTARGKIAYPALLEHALSGGPGS